jgi:hypothetical protein
MDTIDLRFVDDVEAILGPATNAEVTGAGRVQAPVLSPPSRPQLSTAPTNRTEVCLGHVVRHPAVQAAIGKHLRHGDRNCRRVSASRHNASLTARHADC